MYIYIYAINHSHGKLHPARFHRWGSGHDLPRQGHADPMPLLVAAVDPGGLNIDGPMGSPGKCTIWLFNIAMENPL